MVPEAERTMKTHPLSIAAAALALIVAVATGGPTGSATAFAAVFLRTCFATTSA
jgi:hypothetical protein